MKLKSLLSRVKGIFILLLVATIITTFMSCSKGSNNPKPKPPLAKPDTKLLLETAVGNNTVWVDSGATLYAGANMTQPLVLASYDPNVGANGAFLLCKAYFNADGTGNELDQGDFTWTLIDNNLSIEFNDGGGLNAIIQSINSKSLVLYINTPINLKNTNFLSYQLTFNSSSKR